MENPSGWIENIKLKSRIIFTNNTISLLQHHFSMGNESDLITMSALFRIALHLKRLETKDFDRDTKKEMKRNFNYDVCVDRDVFDVLTMQPIDVNDVIRYFILNAKNKADHYKELALLIYLEQKRLNANEFKDSVFVDTVYADIMTYDRIIESIKLDLGNKKNREFMAAPYINFNRIMYENERNMPVISISEKDCFMLVNMRTEKTKTNKDIIKENDENGIRLRIINLYTGSMSYSSM